jgi:GAF domain
MWPDKAAGPGDQHCVTATEDEEASCMTAQVPDVPPRSYGSPRQRLADLEEANSRLGEENARLIRSLAATLEQQTATGEILRVIASSPADLQRVLDTLVEAAARLCGANDALISTVRGDALALMAAWGSVPRLPLGSLIPLDRGSPPGRAVVDGEVTSYCGEPDEIEEEFPIGAALARQFGIRAALSMPLLRAGSAIGCGSWPDSVRSESRRSATRFRLTERWSRAA